MLVKSALPKSLVNTHRTTHLSNVNQSWIIIKRYCQHVSFRSQFIRDELCQILPYVPLVLSAHHIAKYQPTIGGERGGGQRAKKETLLFNKDKCSRKRMSTHGGVYYGRERRRVVQNDTYLSHGSVISDVVAVVVVVAKKTQFFCHSH